MCHVPCTDLLAREAAQALAAVDLAEVGVHLTVGEGHVFAQVAQRLVDAAVVVGRRLYFDVLGDHLRRAVESYLECLEPQTLGCAREALCCRVDVRLAHTAELAVGECGHRALVSQGIGGDDGILPEALANPERLAAPYRRPVDDNRESRCREEDRLALLEGMVHELARQVAEEA